MEQTLGKKIAACRKHLAMTQDQLAERLGVTAQAVSKWENDQSCPDITMLPRLAEIFGVTTDSLLGCEKIPVREAEVVEEDADNPQGFSAKADKGHWEFSWEGGRRGSLCFALFVLLVGILYMSVRVMALDIGLWSILWPSGLLVFGVFGLLRRRFSVLDLCAALAGLYFLLDLFRLLPFRLGGELLWPALIVVFGISLLLDALRKPKKPHFHVTHNGSKKKSVSEYTNTEDGFECDQSFGKAHHHVVLPRLRHGSIDNSFGELTVDLSGVEEVSEDCTVDADCSFGNLVLLVPSRFRVEPRSDTTFAGMNVLGNPAANPAGVIHLHADVSFGNIELKYI